MAAETLSVKVRGVELAGVFSNTNGIYFHGVQKVAAGSGIVAINPGSVSTERMWVIRLLSSDGGIGADVYLDSNVDVANMQHLDNTIAGQSVAVIPGNTQPYIQQNSSILLLEVWCFDIS